jgi:hypothetical protein
MALSSELPVYKASYDLLLAIYQMVKHFAREYKYTLGENLKNQAVELLTLIYRANSRQDKVEIIQSAREHLEIIRLYVRLTKDLHQINTEKLVFINSNIENVSKQLSGWQKSQK